MAIDTRDEISLACWNIHRAVGTDNVKSMRRIAEPIARASPDFIAMQEVPTLEEDQITLQRHLEDLTGVSWHRHYMTGGIGAKEGNAIYSRHPIVAAGGKQLHSAQHGRSVVCATIDFNGRHINIITTHLDSGLDHDESRSVQARLVLDFAAQLPEPRIIAGDFNMTPEKPQIDCVREHYHDGWLDACNAQPCSAEGYEDNPACATTRTCRKRIDYMWHSKGGGLHVFGARIIDTRDRSTYRTSGPTNSNGDVLAEGMWLGPKPVSMVKNTPDDRGIRPSDHNLFLISFQFSASKPIS